MPLTGEYAPSTSAFARNQAELFERSGGVKGNTLQGRPVIIVTSVGARSGKLHKTALMRVEHEGVYAVVASKGGAPTHPSWYFNLVANPLVELQDGPVKKDYRVHVAEGDERDTWWARSCETWPSYADYQKKTDRQIPVLVLTPVG